MQGVRASRRMAACTELEGEDGYSTIRGATLEKAVRELKEDPETRGQAVRELRARIIQKERDVSVGSLVIALDVRVS